MTPKSDFLLIGVGTITSKGPWTKQILEKLHCSLSKIINNKQVLAYGLLESTNDLRGIFAGHIHFKKLMKFRKFTEIFHCCLIRLMAISRNSNRFLMGPDRSLSQKGIIKVYGNFSIEP